jgi:hypothetical protein
MVERRCGISNEKAKVGIDGDVWAKAVRSQYFWVLILTYLFTISPLLVLVLCDDLVGRSELEVDHIQCAEGTIHPIPLFFAPHLPFLLFCAFISCPLAMVLTMLVLLFQYLSSNQC